MFFSNLIFNQDIKSWNVSGVTNVNSMFNGATAMLAKYGDDISTPDSSTNFFYVLQTNRITDTTELTSAVELINQPNEALNQY